MILPHIARHPAYYSGTLVAETGETLQLGRLTEPGDCTLWLDEGGIHFTRPDGVTQLIPRRTLVRAETHGSGSKRAVEIRWTGAGGEPWISQFLTQAPGDWASAVEELKAWKP